MRPERGARKRSGAIGPRPIGPAVERAAAQLAPATLLAAVQQRWEDAVGSDVATYAAPVSERSGTITVACRDSVWAAELELQSRTLLSRLADILPPSSGPHSVTALRFVVAPIEGG